MSKPNNGSMVYWRFRIGDRFWHFGYVTSINSYNLLRMGLYNGDCLGGVVVDIADIEWRHKD